MFSSRTRLISIVVITAVLAALALTGSSSAAPSWTIRIAAASPSDYRDSSGATWLSDRYYQGGTGSGPIRDSVTNTTDDVMYGRHRWGMTAYNVPVPSAGTFRVTLHFAEVVFADEGKRVFDITAEGATKIKAFDAIARAGFATAHIEQFDVAVKDGTLNLGFQALVEDPMVSAIQVDRLTTTSVDSTKPAFAKRIRVASTSAYTDKASQTWSADTNFAGGSTFASTLPIGNTLDDPIYDNNRWGMRGYSFKVPADTYTVRLHFAETAFTSKGKRVFNVRSEGLTVLDNVDVAAEAGPANALVKTFKTNVTDGTLNLRFDSLVGDAMISGIEVLGTSNGSTVPTTTAPPTTTTTKAPVVATTGYPSAANTGVPGGVALASVGGFATTRDGQVIDALDVNGSIRVLHNNVTIRRVRVRNPGGEAIWQDPSMGGLVIEDSELDGTGNPGAESAVAFANYTIRRCNIHHYGEGLAANGNNVIEDNYMHDFTNFIAQGAHQDGIQAEWGDNILIRHNAIMQNVEGANSAIWVSGQSHSNVVIDNNLVAGASFAIGLGNQAAATNNRISTVYYPNGGYFGPFTYTSPTMSGNVWYESGAGI